MPLHPPQVVRPRRLSAGCAAEERVEGFPQPDRTGQQVLCLGRNTGGGLAQPPALARFDGAGVDAPRDQRGIVIQVLAPPWLMPAAGLTRST